MSLCNSAAEKVVAGVLLSEASDLYKKDCIIFRNQSRKTEENHDVAMRALIGFVGDMHVEDLTFEMIRDWKIHLDNGRSPVTVRCYIIKLRVVLVHLYNIGLKVINPDSIPVPKRVEKVPEFLTKEQVAHLIDCTDRIKNKAIVSLLYASGIRVSELCALNRGQWHDDDTFTVVGKGGKPRLCFMDERTTKLLNLYYASRTDNNPAAFLTDGGRRIIPWTVQETFKTIRKRSGINCHPHTLRHSFATDLLMNNANLFHVSKMLGHAQLNTTATYLHVVDNDLKRIHQLHHTF